MNQHSKGGGQANGNSVGQVRSGATRPAAAVGIVLCVGFAVVMSAISSCRKPQSQQEVQTEPKAAVQTEIPKSDADQTEIPTPDETVSSDSVRDRDEWLQPSTTKPVAQATPAAGQLMDDHVNSPAPVQGSPTPVQADQSNTFSHNLNAETSTFEGINPTTKVKGVVTVAITGAFTGERLLDGQSPVGSHLQADQQVAFSFVPYDRYSPSYSAILKLMPVGGDTTDDSIIFNFTVNAKGSDGSSQRFLLKEVVTVNEDGAQVAFEQTLIDH